MIDELKIKIFANDVDIKNIEELCKNPLIRGFTTNTSLMKKKGIIDYKKLPS